MRDINTWDWKNRSMEKTVKALLFAENAHIDQVRKASGLPYIVHCFSVYSIVKQYKTDNSKNLDEICTVCVLHDCLEDTDTTYEQLCDMFGESVADTVLELTNDRTEIKKIGKENYINAKLLKMSNHALLIKLSDMLANVIDSPSNSVLNRIEKHVLFLKKSRELTPAQMKVAKHIERVINGAHLQLALMNRE